MNEGNIRREFYQMLRYRYNLWPDHFPDIPGVKSQPGRPDLVVLHPDGPGFYIEVKALNLSKFKSFAFGNIADGQRKWLSKWEEARPHGSWLGLGTHGVRPREMFLVPWDTWLSIEDRVAHYQNSLPYVAGPGFSTGLQANKLDFSLLTPFKLVRIPPKDRLAGESGWTIPFLDGNEWTL